MFAFTELTRHQQRITCKVAVTKHNLNSGNAHHSPLYSSSALQFCQRYDVIKAQFKQPLITASHCSHGNSINHYTALSHHFILKKACWGRSPMLPASSAFHAFDEKALRRQWYLTNTNVVMETWRNIWRTRKLRLWMVLLPQHVKPSCRSRVRVSSTFFFHRTSQRSKRARINQNWCT